MCSDPTNQASAEAVPLKAAASLPPGLPELPALAQRIVDSIQEGVVVYDRELRYRLWNPFMERITGQAAAEVLGRTAAEVREFVRERGLEAMVQRALAGQTCFLADTAYTQKRTNWAGQIAGTFAPLRDTAGTIIGVLGVIQDVSRRKRLEEAHLVHEQRYRQLFDKNPLPMWVHDVETLAFLAMNEATLSQYGYSREEFLFMTIEGILAPADQPAPPREGAELRGSVDEARLWRHRTKDGRILDVEVNTHVVSFAGRRAVLVVANDVTERLKALQCVRENELKYRTLIEAADIAIFLADAATGQITETNRRAEALLGLPRHKIVGLHLRELSPPELAAGRGEPPTRAPLLRAGPAAQPYVWHRAGRRIPVDIVSSVIEVGGKKMVQSLYRDITERKRSEEALARRSRQLEVLSRANRQLHAVLEIPVVLRTLVDTALELLQATGGMAGLVEKDGLVFREYRSRGQARPVSHRFNSGQGVAGYVLASKLTYCSNEPARDPLVLPEIQSTYHLQNLACVPIAGSDGQLLGCLELHNTENRRSIEDSDLTMLELLAANAALAIENARMLARHAALLESVPEGLLVVDEQGRIASFNQKFVRMWGIPSSILEGRQDEKALEFVLSQLQEPEEFLQKVKQLYASPEADSHDYLEFKDGRVFERFSSPRRVAGELAGRVWSFRDATASFQEKAARGLRRSAARKAK